MGHVRADDLHVHEEILSQGMRDAPTDNIQMARLSCDKIASFVKGFWVNLAKGQTNVIDDRISKSVQQMF